MNTNGAPVMYANMPAYAVPPASALRTNGRSASTRNTAGFFDDGTRVSGSLTYTAYAASKPRIASKPNSARQPATAVTRLPIAGARIGATPITSISIEKTRAASRDSNLSRTTARDTTMPAHAASA